MFVFTRALGVAQDMKWCPIVWEVVKYCSQVGVMYCRAGQQTEEEMYNNEEGGPAFNEFLDVIGQRVRLKGFGKYKAGLCNKSEDHHYIISI